MKSSYIVKVIKRVSVARDTTAFYLEKPDGFEFAPGQNIDVELVDQDKIDPDDCARAFSIASAPHEEHLLIVARMRDNPYKNGLKNLPDGGDVKIYGPYGSFRLHDDKTVPAVFIIGGIGITPCLSILSDAAREKSNRPLYLFYSNREREDAAYLDDLLKLRDTLKNFKCIPTLTDPTGLRNGWKHETGYINFDMIGRHVSNPASARYYIVGPSRMVWAMVQQLDGKIPRANMLVEDFTGF